MFRNPTRDLYCVRNPWIESRTIELPASVVATEARDVVMVYPRRATVGRLEPGEPGLSITLAPYETVFLETRPAGEAAPAAAPPARPEAAVVAEPPRQLPDRDATPTDELHRIRYLWEGALNVPNVAASELCILIEGAPEVSASACSIVLNGREAEVRKVTSAGQFGAATAASPENWTWFIVSLVPGEAKFEIDLTAHLDEASISVYLRGTTPASNDPAPDSGAVFPTFQAGRRAWSQTLQSPKTYVAVSP